MTIRSQDRMLEIRGGTEVGVILLLLLFAGAVSADVVVERELARATIIHCKAPAAEVVYLAEGEEPPAVEGTPVDVGCVVLDTRSDDLMFGGKIRTVSADDGVMRELLMELTVTQRYGSTIRTYRLADWADALSYEANGARYKMRSVLRSDEDGDPLEYQIDFLRRAPDEWEVCVNGVCEVQDYPDRTTLLVIDLAPGVVATLDFRIPTIK